MEKTFVKMLETFKSYAKDSSHEIDSATADKWIEMGLAAKADPVNTKIEQLEKALSEREDKLLDTITKAVATKTDKVWAQPKDKSDKSLNDFLRLVQKGDSNTIEKKYGSVEKASGMTSQSGTIGGYLVPTEYASDFLSVTPEQAIVRPRARVWNMSGNTLTIPALDQSTNQYGGVVLYYKAEGAALTDSNVNVREITLSTRDLTGLCYVTNDLLRDGAIDVGAMVTDQFRKALINREDKEYLVGTGVQGPLGIYNSAAAISVTRATASRVKFADITGMEARMIDNDNAVWVVSKGAQGEFLDMRDGNDRPIWLDNVQGGGHPMLRGRPVLFTGKTGIALGSLGDVALVDFSYYNIGIRGDITVSYSEHVKFTSNEGAFRITYSHDAINGLNAGVKLDDASTTVSNIVVLN